MVSRENVLAMLEATAPHALAAEWDNCGLLIDAKEGFNRLLICVDVTRSVLQEAIDRNCDLIVSHHPLIFDAVKQLDMESVVFLAVKSGISVFAMHTNMDVVQGGLNDALAEALGLLDSCPLYEDESNEASAYGRIGRLGEAVTLETFALTVRERLNTGGLRVCGDMAEKVKAVAVACGAGGDMLDAAWTAGADVLVTGEIKHNRYMDAVNKGLAVIEAGHYHTEKLFVNLTAKRLQALVNRLEYNLEIMTSEREKPPYDII